MKRNLIGIIALVLVLTMMFSLVACSDQKKEGEATDTPVASEPEKTEDPSSGDPGDDDKEYTIVMVAKMDGIAFFDSLRAGVEQFAKDTPGVTAYQIAPEKVDGAKQIAMVEDLIAQGVDAILVTPSDPLSMKQVLQKARDAGIVVVSLEGTNIGDAVDYDVEAVIGSEFGVLFGECIADAMGGEGKYAYQVGGLTMITHMEWFNACTAYLAENHPNMELVNAEPYETENNAQIAIDKTTEAMAAFPDLKGFVGSGFAVGIAQALREKDRGDLGLVVLGCPSEMGDFIKDGTINYGLMWKPADSGYAAAAVAYAKLTGVPIDENFSVNKPGYEKFTFDGNIMYGNGGIVFTKDNIDDPDLFF